jgi:hypothetical protein
VRDYLTLRLRAVAELIQKHMAVILFASSMPGANCCQLKRQV